MRKCVKYLFNKYKDKDLFYLYNVIFYFFNYNSVIIIN